MSLSEKSHNRTPTITEMRVIPVAGRDSMLLNLSGAHGPYFTRNIVVLKDNTGKCGVGEVPGGERIRIVLEKSKNLIIDQPIGYYNRVLNKMRETFGDEDLSGRGIQTFDLRTMVHAVTAVEAAFLAESRWDEVWGFDPELYLPLLRFARMNASWVRYSSPSK